MSNAREVEVRVYRYDPGTNARPTRMQSLRVGLDHHDKTT
ncbi:MAG: hypothetical protein JWN57_3061 [Frankiales bacterium]|nr:hypothetical protein [Frankiales bacterium]